MFTLNAPGTALPAPVKSTTRSQVLGDTLVTLHTNPAGIKANEETILGFTLQRAADQSPLTDLQPYLGEMGHLVIIREAKPWLSPITFTPTLYRQTSRVQPSSWRISRKQDGTNFLVSSIGGGEIVTAPFWVRID